MTEFEVGAQLPGWRIPITTTMVVSAAIATRDFQDVHHDRDLAQSAGSKDIFVNILTSNALVERYVSESLGYDVDLRGIAIRLGAPAYPGDTLAFSGMVASVEGEDVVIEVHGTVANEGPTNGQDHVTGTVKVRNGADA